MAANDKGALIMITNCLLQGCQWNENISIAMKLPFAKWRKRHIPDGRSIVQFQLAEVGMVVLFANFIFSSIISLCKDPR